MLFTQEDNLNNGEDDFFLLYKSQRGGPGPLGPLDTRLRGSEAGVYTHFTPFPPPPK